MATNTTNYNFKKPDESDFYSVQDQNNNWDKADAALKDLDTPTFEDYSGSATVPDAATAIGNIKSKGKLSTTFSNIKAAFKGACLIGQIVNNCVTNNAKLPLSAAQGKALMDLYTKLNSDLGYEYRSVTSNGLTWQLFIFAYKQYRIIAARAWVEGVSITTAWGNGLFASENIASFSYPEPFNTTPIVLTNFYPSSGNAFTMTTLAPTAASAPQLQLVRGTALSVNGTIEIVSIGDIK
ncbi:hypothetical protein HMPREF1093_03576 [Hungatella hathewayi 12489931]|uniref:hypothetical protein n=1 Tax=Hungatella hathewayi TaxID=154046 RepID=UPI0002D17EE4|nr:hypothetical protein [Hungatella hathewayi]ENY93500.1 hypothetical protein HMPREF1093_03576 [Hungatella hathewayi 12489931]